MRKNRLMNLLTLGICSMFLLAGCTSTQSQEQKLSFDEPSYTTSPEWVKALGEKNQATQLFCCRGKDIYKDAGSAIKG